MTSPETFMTLSVLGYILKLSTQEKQIQSPFNTGVILKKAFTAIHHKDFGMRLVGGKSQTGGKYIAPKGQLCHHARGIPTRARLKPYLLSLLLSGEQTQIQWWKVPIVFEGRSGWWGFSGQRGLVTTNDPLKRYYVM